MALGLLHGENTKNLNIPRKNLRKSQVKEKDIEIGQEADRRRDTLRRPRRYEMAHLLKMTM